MSSPGFRMYPMSPQDRAERAEEHRRSLVYRLAPVLSILLMASFIRADTFIVNRGDDGSGSGTLRWAIEQANSTPGSDTIAIQATASTVYLLTPLPPVTGSVDINGPVIIDGSNLTAGDGLVIATDHATLRYVTARKFPGDGFVVAGSRNSLEFPTGTGNRNGLRVEGTQNSVFGGTFSANRANGVWLTAAASGSVVGRYLAPCNILCPPLAAGNTISANAGAGIVVDSDSNTLDTNDVRANGSHGILVRGTGNRIHNSQMSYNTGDGLHLFAAVESDDRNAGTCNGGRFVAAEGFALPPAPRVLAGVDDLNVVTVSGDLHGQPDTAYSVQALALPDSCNSTEPARRLGATPVTTDSSGYAAFHLLAGKFDENYQLLLQRVAATARPAASPGGLSDVSDAIEGIPNRDHRADLAVSVVGPREALPYSTVTFETRVTNHGPAAISSLQLSIPPVAGTELVTVSADKGACYLGGVNWCELQMLGAGETAVVRHTLRLSGSGPYLYSVNASLWPGDGNADPNLNDNRASASVYAAVTPTSRRRASSH